MPKRKSPRIKIGGSKRPKGAYPVPTGGYVIPAGKHHGAVYVESVVNDELDMKRLARTLLNWAKQEQERQKLTSATEPPDEPEPTSSDQHPAPPRSQ